MSADPTEPSGEPPIPDATLEPPDRQGPDDLTTVLNDRLTGAFPVDSWGFDRQLAGQLGRLARVRWRVDVDGGDLLPDGPALVVFSRWLGWTEPWVLATGFGMVGRDVRIVGAPDREPVASTLGRLGWVPATPADVRGIVRDGRMAAIGAERSVRHRFQPGRVDGHLLHIALDLRLPVVPVAVVGREVGRRWKVLIGAPVHTARRSSIDGAALADRARERLGQLLEASRPRHLPF